MMGIEKELSENRILLSVFSGDHYNESVLETMKELEKERICYVTLNKPSSSLKKRFNSKKINSDKIFFIDAVSAGIGKKNSDDNVVFVSSPMAFTELGIAISEALKAGSFDVLFFDSLSTLNVYDQGIRAERFSNSMVNKIKTKGSKGILTCLNGDLKTALVRNISLNVDHVLRFKEFNEVMDQKKQAVNFGVTLAVVFVCAFSLLSFTGIDIFGFGAQTHGLAIGEGLSSAKGLLIFSFFSLLIGVAIFLFFNKIRNSIKIIPKKRLKNIKPAKGNDKEVENTTKNKIKNWVKKGKV